MDSPKVLDTWESLQTSYRVLFNNPQPKRQYWTAIDESTIQSAPSAIDKTRLGYLVFPTDSSKESLLFHPLPGFHVEYSGDARPPALMPASSHLAKATKPASTPAHQADSAHEHPDSGASRTQSETQLPMGQSADARQQQIVAEATEARKGEEEWVRSGGILRDAQGNRDYIRTEAIRKELAIRDEENRLQERWERYEASWARLSPRSRKQSPVPLSSKPSTPISISDLSPGSPGERNVRFTDIPWPVEIQGGNRQLTVHDLTLDKVQDFLMGNLKRSGSPTAKRERIRSSLLRWHPDKMRGLLSRVVESDVQAVEEGINAVVRCLQLMNNRFSASPA